jgi:hypothetical protein
MGRAKDELMRLHNVAVSKLRYMIVLFNGQMASFMEHNLEEDEAWAAMEEPRSDEIPAYILQQKRQHPDVDPDDCSGCLRDFEEMLEEL